MSKLIKSDQLETKILPPIKNYIDTEVGKKQPTLVSGTNIKTVNGNSLLGSGDISITGGAEFEITASSDSASLGQGNDYLGVDLSDANGPTLTLIQPGTYAKGKTLQEKLVSGTNIKTINNESILGSGNINIQGGGGVEAAIIDVDNFNMTISEFTQLFFSDKLLYIRYGGKNHLVNGKYNWTLLPEEEYELSYIEGNTIITHQFEVSDDVYYRGTDKKSAGVDIAVGEERWYGTYTDENNVTYQVYTKTIFIPALPSAAGITTYPIGVTNMKQIISISGVTTDGFVLNAPRQTASDNIAIYQVSKGSQTFSIEVGKDRSSKKAYVTIIYTKNN